jgi:peptide/nickel transport system substrate-binding protein
MTMNRRELMAGAAALGGAAGVASLGGEALAQAAPRGTLRIIPHASLTTLDPVATTGYIVRNHGYMIWDTLFAMNEQLQPQPQMASGVEISADKLTYRITLRDGLAWHDDTPVTAEDCALSLIRWGKVDGMGIRLFSYVDSVTHDGTKVIVIKLKTPYGLVLESIGKLSTNVPFMMPKRFAEKPHTERLTANDMIGSGPFKWVGGEYRPGARVVYERNAKYVPRSEPASNASGGKVVHLERVEWVNFPDPTTALNALISGEVDYYEQVPADLLPVVARAPGVKVGNFNPLGNVGMARFNSQTAPTNNPAVRRAIAKAINQNDMLRAAVGSPDFFKACHSVFPCGTTFDSKAGIDWISQSSIDEARKILREGGYNGEKLVILATTDIPIQTAFATVLTDVCRRIGINVEAQAMDWATVLQRRTNRNPVDQGGWNIFVTWWEGADVLDPVVQFALSGAGDRAWVGWANDPTTEDLRKQFAEAPDIAAKKAIADRVQLRQHEQMFQAYLGQFFVATGYRDNVSGILNAPPFFWNIRKS